MARQSAKLIRPQAVPGAASDAPGGTPPAALSTVLPASSAADLKAEPAPADAQPERPSPVAERPAPEKPDPPITARRDAPSKPIILHPAKSVQRGRGRRLLRGFLMLGGIAAVVVTSGMFWLRGGRYISADDAYVRAAKLMVSTDVSGLVTEIDIHEGDRVAANQVLFKVDPRQYEIALAMAKAQLGQVELTLNSMREDYRRILSDIDAQTAQVDLAQSNFDRAATLMKSDFGTRATYDQTRYTLLAAQKTLQSLKQQARVALARLGGDANLPNAAFPQWQQAKAAADEVQRQLDHTVVRAPFAGIVTQVDALQLGTYLVSQTAALTNTGAVGLVSTDRVWIDANLKETDLTYVTTGDKVDITVDAYPGRVWTGKVGSISPASGSEFSILPAQNASGNWVKVVQRIPVRILVEQKEGYPELRSGMSVIVEIDTGHKRSLPELWGGASAEARDGGQSSN